MPHHELSPPWPHLAAPSPTPAGPPARAREGGEQKGGRSHLPLPHAIYPSPRSLSTPSPLSALPDPAPAPASPLLPSHRCHPPDAGHRLPPPPLLIQPVAWRAKLSRKT